jgi:hypothetical protein
MNQELSSQLQKVIEAGEKLSSGTYKLVDGYKIYEKWRTDCLQFFENLQDGFNSALQSPEDIKQGVRFLEELLTGDDSEEESE